MDSKGYDTWYPIGNLWPSWFLLENTESQRNNTRVKDDSATNETMPLWRTVQQTIYAQWVIYAVGNHSKTSNKIVAMQVQNEV
jgi:hypothetical protein